MMNLAGKTIKSAKRSMYGNVYTITFTDGSRVEFYGQETKMHNDRWIAIEANCYTSEGESCR